MRILIGLNALSIGGTESYALTVAEHLDRLAHDVAIYTPEPGRGVELAQERGLHVVGPHDVPAGADVALVQDAAVAYELAERRPGVKQVFVGHSESFNPQTPPQLPGVVEVAVALNDRVAQRLRGFAGELDVVRLRQPIDTERFLARGGLPETPRQALILSNNHVADRQAMLEWACAEAGLELARVGGHGAQSNDPRSRLAAADVVIGYGRSILEAMSIGRAAFVYDWSGGEGWVTADSYPAIEADGFAGRGEAVLDADHLAESLRGYNRAMGPVNRDLIVANHRANVHVQDLLDVFEQIGTPRSRPAAPLGEMARLVRLEWRARSEIHGLLAENAHLRELLDRQAGDCAAQVQSYESSLSWRLTKPLRLLSALRRRLRRR